MPIRKVKGGWTFGGGVFKTREAALRAYAAYRAKKSAERKSKKKGVKK